MKKKVFLAGISISVAALWAADDWELPLEEPQLKPGPNLEVVSQNCQMCHSADYIFTQPRMNWTAWSNTVQKMRDKYGAPLPTSQVQQVLDYLVTTYGKK